MLLLRTRLDDTSKGKLELIEAIGRNIPDYAILSHTWGDDEVLYVHVHDGTAHLHEAYGKVVSAIRQAASDGLAYVWIDSCCIDKSSSAELSEALNSMYAWYQRAEVCYAYLEDVPERRSGDFEARFAGSRWFTRGWTLQELLAPTHIDFFGKDRNCEWTPLGNSFTLQSQISEITSIEVDYLSGRKQVHEASIAKRMSWVAGRETKREEDIAYCLLGLFSINMPMLYGEGSRAFLRLQEEIIKRSDDQSIFAWAERSDMVAIDGRDSESIAMKLYRSTTQLLGLAVPTAMTPEHSQHGLLADRPSLFAHSRNFVPCRIFRKKQTTFQISNRGLGITLPLLSHGSGFIASLECRDESRSDNKFLGIHVTKTGRAPNQYARVRCDVLMEDRPFPGPSSWRDLFFRQTADKELETAMTRYIMLRHVPCQDNGEDGWAATRIVHFKVLSDESSEAREVYSDEATKGCFEPNPSQSTMLRLRSAHGRLLEQHMMTISLVRQSDRKRLLVIIGVDRDLTLTFAVNPSALEATRMVDLSLAQFNSNIGSSRLAVTTEDGDHIAAVVRRSVERHRDTTAIDLHTWRGGDVCADHAISHLPMADEKCIDLWT